jgi:hypothetical protein
MGVDLGCIGGEQVYIALKNWHGIDGALLQFLQQNAQHLPNKKVVVKSRDETLLLGRGPCSNYLGPMKKSIQNINEAFCLLTIGIMSIANVSMC